MRFVNFRDTVPATKEINLETRSPLTGHITHLTLHFPTGCVGLVEMRVLINRVPIWPTGNQDFALDDATPTYDFPPPGHPIKKQDYLGIRIHNHDTAFSHTPSVILALFGDVRR